MVNNDEMERLVRQANKTAEDHSIHGQNLNLRFLDLNS